MLSVRLPLPGCSAGKWDVIDLLQRNEIGSGGFGMLQIPEIMKQKLPRESMFALLMHGNRSERNQQTLSSAEWTRLLADIWDRLFVCQVRTGSYSSWFHSFFLTFRRLSVIRLIYCRVESVFDHILILTADLIVSVWTATGDTKSGFNPTILWYQQQKSPQL